MGTKKSWRSTAYGIVSILAALAAAGMAYFDGDPMTKVDWAILIGLITNAGGLFQTRDHGVSSREAGIEPR